MRRREVLPPGGGRSRVRGETEIRETERGGGIRRGIFDAYTDIHHPGSVVIFQMQFPKASPAGDMPILSFGKAFDFFQLVQQEFALFYILLQNSLL